MGLFSYAKALEKVTHSNEKVSEKRFYPPVPQDLNQTGLHEKLIEELIFKLLHSQGVMTGRLIADEICLPFKIIEQILLDLKKQMFLAYRSDSGINDFVYMLTDQ